MGENRKSNARLCAYGSQAFVGLNSPAPALQLKSLRDPPSTISYRKWNFRVVDVPRSFLKYGPLERKKYSAPPSAPESGESVMMRLITPLYALSTTCDDWYVEIHDFLITCG